MAEIKKGSIITIKVNNKNKTLNLTIIGVVSKVVDGFAYCKHSVTSQNGAEFKNTKDILSTYKGDPIEGVKLIDQEHFDLVYDSRLIPREVLKNL